MLVVGRLVEWLVSGALKRERGSVDEEILRNNSE